MKRKTFIAILAIAMVLVLSLAILTACNNKKHDFSSKWEYDETSHWHECMTKKHSDVADKADHTFDAGVVTTQPTEAAEGVKTLTCTVCGYQKTESVPQLEHTFDMGKWKFDEQTHWHPATCAHTDLKKDEAEHTWNEGVVTTHPTETTEGVKTYTCTVCGNTKTAKIGMLDHKHTFDMTKWSYNAENHWHPATCGHTDEKKDLGAHVWNEGVVTTQPTETTEGVKTYTCTTCGNTKTATIGMLDHKHTFDTERWDHDAENHWHPATCAHTSEKKDLAAHDWNEGVVTTAANYGVDGEKTFTCTTCSATRKETIPALEPKTNTISFASGLSLDKTYDGTPVVVAADKVNRKGNGAITIEYMREDESTYSTVAPKDAGTYHVRASVAPTAEWLGGKIETEFTIEHRILTLSESVYSRKIDQTLESGKFGLECKNVAEETNNVVTWVTIGVPEQYRAAGIHNMRVSELIVDNPNFVIESNTSVRLTVWDAPEFYAGVEDVLSIPGRGTVLSVQIANGTVNTGDQLHINELGKVFTVTAIETNRQVLESATAGDTVGLLTKDVERTEVERGYTLTKLDTVASYDKVTATIRVAEDKKTPIATGYAPNARFVFIEGIGNIPSTIKFPTGSNMLMPGETLAGVTVDFQGATVPAFVGRRFLLIEGSKTVAEGVVTDVAPKTRVNCTVSEPTGKTAVIEPIQGGEKTFALNLNRSNVIEDLVNSEAIDVVVKYDGVIVGSYKRTGLGVGEGDLAHVENGGTLKGSYININLAKGVAGLTDADGNWICDQANVTFDVSATLTQQVDNLAAGSVTTISIGANDVKYFTLNELEPLTSGWYSFVNAFNTNGSSRYAVYTDAGVKVDMMSDMFKSNGGKYYVRYTVNANILNAQIGFIAAKGELSATNTTKSLIIPSGNQGDRVVIKVTLNKALSYFYKNTVTFKQNVSAFNGSVVKVYDSNYRYYNAMGYQSLPSGHRFYLPTQNSEQTYAYIMMKYAADLTGTAELKFEHSAAGVQLLNENLQTVPFKANESRNFMFKVPTTGQYKIEIVATDSNVLIPPTTISVDKVYDTNFATVTINDNTKFNANATGGYYSLTLKNMTDSEQRVRIHVVKVA